MGRPAQSLYDQARRADTNHATVKYQVCYSTVRDYSLASARQVCPSAGLSVLPNQCPSLGTNKSCLRNLQQRTALSVFELNTPITPMSAPGFELLTKQPLAVRRRPT